MDVGGCIGAAPVNPDRSASAPPTGHGADRVRATDTIGTMSHDLLALAESVAREAGELVRKGREGSVEVAATKSSPTDVVTAVDLASEKLIRERILTARPDDAFIGEEGDDVVGSSGLTWVADPIDGTVNYLYGLPSYAVSLAVQTDGRSVVGVVHNPASGETFTAARGAGAFLDGVQIRANPIDDPARALVGTGYGYRVDVRTHQAAELERLVPRIRDLRRIGSAALDLCSVACGRLDAYVERGLKPWDLAAGQLIAEEAGARVAGLNGAEPSELLVVCAAEELFDPLHELLLDCGYDAWPLTDWPA